MKRIFGVFWVALVFAAALHSALMLLFSSNRWVWSAAVLALWPILIFFIGQMGAGKGRAATRMTLPLICAVIGFVIAAYNEQILPTIYAGLIGVVGILLYDYWYSILPRPTASKLAVHAPLPVFEVVDTHGALVSSVQWQGLPLLLMFIRGNWCPLCVAQVGELAKEYRRIAAKGVRLAIVTAQSAEETQKLAERFDVPFEFYADMGGQAAATIGIQHESGVPLGMASDSTDTIIPTVVICDERGVVCYLDIAENYRARPEPELLLRELGID